MRSIIRVPRTVALALKNDSRRSIAAVTDKEWRKQQLEQLESRFTKQQQKEKGQQQPLTNIIEHEDDLQPMWKSLESRISHRRPMTLEERNGHSGRTNVRKTDEDAWLEGGLYSDNSILGNNSSGSECKK